MRSYAEPIIAHPDPALHHHTALSLHGSDAAHGDGRPPEGPPRAFLWRGRHYAVRAVVATWLDHAPWWRGASQTVRRCWRVEASAGMAGGSSVVDLACDADGTWHLLAVLD
ncbi:MAG: DUF6504 family protein [Dermatophilaceae bacterium]|nr:DUF6504 family protein [Intrasporangiaceae bacterium]